MTDVNALLITLLLELVEKTPDTPRRILFKGVSDLYDDFCRRVTTERPEWTVHVTQTGADVVGARNDPAIAVLVVFYQDEVRERESLNAFRTFTEDEIAKQLIARLSPANLLPGLPEPYSDEERERLAVLLDLAYPSVRRLAEFLLAGKSAVGDSLPRLGLFRDPNLRLGLSQRQWGAQLRDNHQAAVLRWRDFLDKGANTKAGRAIIGDTRVQLLRAVEIDPARRTDVLAQVTLNEALSVLNPPTRLVERIMAVNYSRDQAEEIVRAAKAGAAGFSGHFDLSKLTAGLLPLTEALQHELARLAPQDKDDDDPPPDPEADLRRVGFCLEGLLRLARQEQIAFPRQLELRRTDNDSNTCATITVGDDNRLSIALTSEAARVLSMPGASGTGELQYAIHLPSDKDFRFTLGMLPRWLESFAEDWLKKEYWDQAEQLNPDYVSQWRALRDRVAALRDVVDPDWKRELTDEPESAAKPGELENREPNNPIYAIFDLLYFAHRDLFDGFLDAWLTVATLPWRDTRLAQKQGEWRAAVDGLLRLGTAQFSDGQTVIFPFHPLRLAWYREVFRQIEMWLVRAVREGKPLVFDPGVLADQLRPVDRPRALFDGEERLLEAAGEGTFVALFVPEKRRQRVRPPVYRARQKLEQFGTMWPFSFNRFHLAFRPADAGDDIYRLLEQQSDDHPEAAYRVRAMVESTGITTIFDRQLLGTSDDIADLMTQEHHESFFPRVEYAKGQLETARVPSELQIAPAAETPSSVHVALLVDAFSVDKYGFRNTVGRLVPNPHWTDFDRLRVMNSPEARQALCQVDIAAPPYHIGLVNTMQQEQTRDLVYVPFSGDRPEYMRVLYDCLMASRFDGDFSNRVYFEQVHWDIDRLRRLHDYADWVLLFDRTLDKTLFETLSLTDVCLIDYYPNLPGGYRMAISSQRTKAVAWQLSQVLSRFFSPEEMIAEQVAAEMLKTLSRFAGGLLLKTLGGGSLAQELLGLYATYRFLIAEGEFVPEEDKLIPLDDYQGWFGWRTQRGRRADLLVLRTPAPGVLRLVAVESKWYKENVGAGFVADEFGDNGQMRTAVETLRSLFDPVQERLDKDYWQKTLLSQLDIQSNAWDDFRRRFGSGDWTLEVDGIVYVHWYKAPDDGAVAASNMALSKEVAKHLHFPDDQKHFCLGPDAQRLRIKGPAEIVQQFVVSGH